MPSSRRLVTPGLILAGFRGSGVWATGKRRSIDLSRGSSGALPSGFIAARTGGGAQGSWGIQEDGTAAGGRGLVQTSTDGTDYRFPLAIYDALSAVDVDVTVRFKAISGRADRAAGLAARLTDPDNYYVARANALEDNVNLYRVVNGIRREIAGARANVTANVWHRLGLRVEKDRLTVSFNGSVLVTASDRTLMAVGRIALWTKADSVTMFDAMSVEVLP